MFTLRATGRVLIGHLAWGWMSHAVLPCPTALSSAGIYPPVPRWTLVCDIMHSSGSSSRRRPARPAGRRARRSMTLGVLALLVPFLLYWVVLHLPSPASLLRRPDRAHVVDIDRLASPSHETSSAQWLYDRRLALADALSRDPTNTTLRSALRQVDLDVFHRWLPVGAHLRPVVASDDGKGVQYVGDERPRRRQVLQRIPVDRMITMQVVEQSRAGHALVNGPSDSKPSVHVLLGVYLAVERADPSSTWQPYIRVLPASFAGSSPIKAPGWVFDEVLRGTAARDLIVLRRKEIRDEYQEIVRRTLPAVSFDQYEWGVLVSMTRAAAVTIDGQKTAALIPLLNEIRHSPASEATTTDRFVQNEHVVMATGRPVSPQLGLTRNYGHRPAQVYYVDYGFVPERPQPALDTFKVEFDPRDADDKDGRLRHLVGDWRRSWTLTSESPIDPGMAQVLRLLARNASERALPDATGRALISAGNEERARVALADAIRRKVGELRRVPPAPDDQHDVHQIEMAVAMRRLEADAAQRFLDRVLADAGQRLTTTTEAAPAPAAGAFVGEDPFDALRQWMEAGGADLSGVRVVHEDDAGQRGLRAHRPMSQGDVVISVPLSLIITSALAGDCDVAKEARRNGVDLETHALMAALLATSWAHDARDVAVGTPGATLSPYLSLFNATLPSLSSYESFLAQYYPTDLLAMLEGTRTLALVNGTRHVLDRDYDALRRAAPRSMANVSRRAYARARHLVDTRNFIVDVDRDANRTLNMMVPFVDMMNHGLAPNAFWAFDPDRAEFQVTAARSIADGDAIVTSYGIKSNGILLTVYGFALPDNPHDVAQMRFRLFPGTTPGRATATATTCTVPATTNDDAVWECVRKVQRGRTDLQVVDAIDEAAADALAMFAGSIDDDLRLLQRDRFDDDRQRSVVRVRLGEKRVLAYWRATAAVLRPYYAGQVSIDALPSDLADFVRQWQQQQQEAGRR